MSSQYRTSESEEQEREEMSHALIEQLETFLEPLLTWLDAYVDRRLVRTLLLSIAAILTFRNGKQGLCLSELGAYLLSGAHAPAGTKRLSRLLHCEKWEKGLIERFLWMRADKRREQLEQEGEEVLCIWDGSVIEKPESERTAGLCSVRSSKARRLRKQRKGNWNPPGGKAITVLGMEWLALLVVGMKGVPEVTAMRWWSRKGENATTQREEEQRLLLKGAVHWGRGVLHVFDRGYASKGWLQWLQTLQLRFVIRWKKGHLFLDQDGQEKKLWQIARGKRSWGHRQVWDEKKKAWCKMGVVAMPIRHAGYAGALWLVVGRRKGEPWYLITDERIETEQEAWHLIFVYARRWQIELSFRYGKSELAMESSRLQHPQAREKLLLMVTLAYAYLLSLVRSTIPELIAWLLRHFCHRTGQKCHQVAVPLYRLRWALSRFWLESPPFFDHVVFSRHPGASNLRSQSSG